MQIVMVRLNCEWMTLLWRESVKLVYRHHVEKCKHHIASSAKLFLFVAIWILISLLGKFNQIELRTDANRCGAECRSSRISQCNSRSIWITKWKWTENSINCSSYRSSGDGAITSFAINAASEKLNAIKSQTMNTFIPCDCAPLVNKI